MSYNTWQWVNVQSIAAYRWTERSSLYVDLRVGGHLALTDFHSRGLKVISRTVL